MPLHIEIAGLKIAEPATMLTDYLMAAVAVWFAVSLWRSGRKWWAGAFGAFALSAFLGGSWHGFQLELPADIANLLWRFTVSAGLVSACLLMIAAAALLQPVARRTIAALALLKLAIALLWAWQEPTFIMVLVDFCVSFGVVLGIAVTQANAAPGFGSRLAAATGLFALGGAIQVLHISPHPWFNHNDLFHLVQIAANTFIFLAAKRTPATVPSARESAKISES